MVVGEKTCALPSRVAVPYFLAIVAIELFRFFECVANVCHFFEHSLVFFFFVASWVDE